MRDLRIFSLYFQHVFQHRARAFVYFLISFINPLVLLMFWTGASQGRTFEHGWTLEKIQTYYLLIIVAQSALIHHIEIHIAFIDIKQGELIRDLLKPISYLKLRAFMEFPWRIFQGSYGIVAVLIFLTFGFKLYLTQDTSIIFMSIVVTILAFIFSFLLKMVIGLFAFWMTDVDSVLESNDVLIILFSGTLMPLNLMPEAIQNVMNFTPYPYIIYYPVSSFIGLYSQSRLNEIMVVQLCWIVGLYFLYKILWKNGLKVFTGVGQ
ncbi:MAG: ABC-2 family transporter protein [Patescibacteria group bacterium]